MKNRRLPLYLLLSALVLPGLAQAQIQIKPRAVTVMSINAQSLLGAWLATSELKQPGVDMTTTGEKIFRPNQQVEDRMTTSVVLKEHSPIPVVFAVKLESSWKLIRDGQFLCEKLSNFSVSLISKPDDNVLPGFLVGQMMDQMQSGLKSQVVAGKGNCNQVEMSSKDTFAHKDGQSGLITQFKRVK
jgi:hypothetical protein